jgi:anthranilate phosphoribosyltransferase
MALHEYMKRVVEQREVLSRSQARALLNLVLAGSTEADQPGSPHSLQLAALLGAIAARGVTAAELAGFAEAMLAAAIPVPLNDAERALLVDTCGTGGDDTGTFNISTAAALVAAAAGADAGSRMMVAKHGNRAVTSQCGSADVLEALGIPISLTPAAGAASLRRHRFAFLHAPSLHPAMKAVMPIRRATTLTPQSYSAPNLGAREICEAYT